MEHDLKVPFYPNTKDDTHCFQACLKMVLKYFFPDEEYSWEELERITAKKPGLWTWPMAGLLWLRDKGVEVRNIELFDYERFSIEGEEYLREEFGEEVCESQKTHSDLEQEKGFARGFFQNIQGEKRIPDIEEMKGFLHEGWILLCNVNKRALDGREGYSGHTVVVSGFDNAGFILHDPGLPPRENLCVSFQVFDKAWSYPDEKARNIVALKK